MNFLAIFSRFQTIAQSFDKSFEKYLILHKINKRNVAHTYLMTRKANI